MRLEIEGTTREELRWAVRHLRSVQSVNVAEHGDTIEVAMPVGKVQIGAQTDGPAISIARMGVGEPLERLLDRIIGALFRRPGVTPVPDEYWMMLARSAAERSSSIRMSVGSALVHSNSLLAVGANEVPVLGGGLAWSDDSTDTRDFVTAGVPGLDRRSLVETAWIGGDVGRAPDQWEEILGTTLGLIDVERAIHAEVAALVDAARRGVSTQGATIYVTHQPCYRCARLLTAAGVREVVFDSAVQWKISPEMLRLLDSSIVTRRFDGIRWDLISVVRVAVKSSRSEAG